MSTLPNPEVPAGSGLPGGAPGGLQRWRQAGARPRAGGLAGVGGGAGGQNGFSWEPSRAPHPQGFHLNLERAQLSPRRYPHAPAMPDLPRAATWDPL